MDTAISHKEMRMDNGSDFLVDDFFDICVAVPIEAIASFSLLFVSDGVPLAQPSVNSHKRWYPFAMKTEQYSFGKARLKANNTCRWSTVRWGFIFIFISLYISLHCCMSEVNPIVLPGHLIITGYRTVSYVWGEKSKKVSIYVYLCRHFRSVIYLWRIGM